MELPPQAYEDAYFPRAEQDLRPSTLQGYRKLWAVLEPFCQGLWIRDIRTAHIQIVLDSMARTGRFNKLSMKHIKAFLSGVFRLAIQQDYYAGENPVRESSLPKVRKASETHAHSLEEVLLMIDAVPEPVSTMIATAAFLGVRRGELRGLRWENYHDGEFMITESVWNGISSEPKTEKSKAPIPVIPKLAGILGRHRKAQNTPISGPVFPNGAGNAADPDSSVRRVILPALDVCGHCSKTKEEHTAEGHKYERNDVLPKWHGWHAFRRGLASVLYGLGADDLTVQRILRHSKVTVTREHYIKMPDEKAISAMQKLEDALSDTFVTPKAPVRTIKGVM